MVTSRFVFEEFFKMMTGKHSSVQLKDEGKYGQNTKTSSKPAILKTNEETGRVHGSSIKISSLPIGPAVVQAQNTRQISKTRIHQKSSSAIPGRCY